MSNRDISSHNAWASPNLRIQTGEDGSIDLQAGSLLKYTSLRLDADQTEDLLNWLQRREGRPAPTLQEPFIPLDEGDTSETTGYRIVPDNDGWHWRWVWIEPDEDDETSPPFASREDAVAAMQHLR